MTRPYNPLEHLEDGTLEFGFGHPGTNFAGLVLVKVPALEFSMPWHDAFMASLWIQANALRAAQSAGVPEDVYRQRLTELVQELADDFTNTNREKGQHHE